MKFFSRGEILLLSCVESYRKRKKVTTHFEQKADGIFLMQDKKLLIEIGHLERSGGYGYVDRLRTAWDHLRGAVGNIYMLKDLSCRFGKAKQETFSKIKVCFLHAYGNLLFINLVWVFHSSFVDV